MAVPCEDSQYFSLFQSLALLDSVVRANRCAAAAADASVGIDMIDITLRDCLYGAY